MSITVIGIIGCTGRMGHAIASIIETHPHACLAGGLTRSSALPAEEERVRMNITDDPSELFPECDVLIDFSHPSATSTFAHIAQKHGKPFMSGTTGLKKEDFAVLREASETIPVLYAPNTSLSLAVTRRLVQNAAHLLKDYDYDVSILDRHHKWKKDAPSGTALALGKAVTDGCQNQPAPTYCSIRSGAIIGEHEVLFAGDGETIAIKHNVTDRRVFARGAVQAALWLAQQKTGYYSMDDVLGL